LQSLTKRILNLVREIDIVGRYGGEEFTIILPETDCSEAVRVAERLRQFAASVPVQTDRDEVIITVCLGVAEAQPDAHDFPSLVARADAAMYDAKRGGQDRVAFR
jgi:diguanylate cyclase (GGDEF)-like protein